MRTRRWAVRLTTAAVLWCTTLRSLRHPLQPYQFHSSAAAPVLDDVGQQIVHHPSYNDTRPIAPNGYLCVFGTKGRLNNKIVQNLVGLHMARRINRTLLVDPEVSEYYDVDRLSLSVSPDSPYAAAVPMTNDNECGDPKLISPYDIDRSLNIMGRFDRYGEQTRAVRLASVDNTDVWYWLGRPPEDAYMKFFAGLVPRRSYIDKVDAFLDGHGLRDGSYNALHLRYFEGRCGDLDLDLCCPKLDYVNEILVERDGDARAPLFVANDGQCPPDVLGSYTAANDDNNNATNTTIGDAAATDNNAGVGSVATILNGYDGPCTGTECAVLDFELCVRSSIFVGNLKSSGDQNIREWRVARYNDLGRKKKMGREDERAVEEGGGPREGGAKHVFEQVDSGAL